ncbi:hypothetical protein GCM10009016_27310 [Halomonas beimenensis]
MPASTTTRDLNSIELTRLRKFSVIAPLLTSKALRKRASSVTRSFGRAKKAPDYLAFLSSTDTGDASL